MLNVGTLLWDVKSNWCLNCWSVLALFLNCPRAEGSGPGKEDSWMLQGEKRARWRTGFKAVRVGRAGAREVDSVNWG